MSEIVACRICLATDNVKLCSIIKYKLAQAYESITGTQFSVDDGLPSFICVYCSALLNKFTAFKETCLNTQDLLKCFLKDLKIGKFKIDDLQNWTPTTLNCLTKTFTDQVIDIEYHEPEIKEEVKEESRNEGNNPKKRKRRKSSKSNQEMLFLKLEDEDDIAYQDDIEFSESKECEDLNMELVVLTKEEQIREIESRKESANYLNSVYKCDKCYKGFLSETTFNNHMLRHDTSRGSYVCEVCLCVWAEARALRSHVITTHERKYICKLCNVVSRNANRAREHSEWHGGRRWACAACGLSFGARTSHLTHVRLHHPSPHSCPLCGESFLGPAGLNLHTRKAHAAAAQAEAGVSCEECGRRFSDERARQRHRDDPQHCAPALSVCGECGAGFDSEEALRAHRDQLHQDTACQQCKKQFVSARSLSTHIERVHLGIKMKQPRRGGAAGGAGAEGQGAGRRGRWLVCEVCGQRCTSAGALAAHQRVHSGEKPYHCSQCPKSFSVAQRLQIHMRTHTGEAPYACAQCPKAFKHKAALNRHARVHSGARPYACAHCPKAFSQSNSMKLHVRTVHLRLPAPYRRAPRPPPA